MARWVGRWEGGRIREGRDRLVWTIERMVAGVRRTIPLEARTEREALAELALFARDPAAYRLRSVTAPKPKPTGPVIDERLVEAFLRAGVAQGLTRRYLTGMRGQLAWWADELRGRAISDCSTGDLLAMLEGASGRKWKLITLKALAAWLRSTARMAGRDDPTLDLKVPQSDPARARAPRWSSMADVARLYALVPTQGVRDVLQVRCATGMHHTEVIRLVRGGVGSVREVWDGDIAAVIDFRHKSGRVHRLSIDARTLGSVRRLLAPRVVRDPTGLPSESHIVRLCADVAAEHGITPVPPGQIRHSFATWARMAGEQVHPSERGLPIEAVAAALGHASAETTRRYYDQSDRPPMLRIRGLRLEHPDDPPAPSAPRTLRLLAAP